LKVAGNIKEWEGGAGSKVINLLQEDAVPRYPSSPGKKGFFAFRQKNAGISYTLENDFIFGACAFCPNAPLYSPS
jgi:hypothetical protein